MKASASLVPKVLLPGDAGRWAAEVNLDVCDLIVEPRTKERPPSVSVMQTATGRHLFRATAEKLRDGLHFYVTPYPHASWAPLHLALRQKPVREAKMSATAAVLAAVALHCKENKKVVVEGGAHLDWMKKVHLQVLKQLEQQGLNGLQGVSSGFLALVRECMRLVDRAMNRDVDDAVERVRTEFTFLMDHLTEEDIVVLWREALVDSTHAR